MDLNHHIHVLTGPVQGGKTTFMTKMITQLKHKGVRVRGFLCPGTMKEGRRTDFTLVNIHTGQMVSMGSEMERPDWIKYRRFYFNPEAFSEGRAWIKESLTEKTDLLLIDEVGPMEMEGMGWSEVLGLLENKTGINQLWIVRRDIVPEVCKKWRIADQQVFTTKSMDTLFRKWEI